ncbi:MAG: 3-hydroxyacyl-CoA dehydrogenase NAD-binding domain-containing protein, partial [Pseudomonadota bacterium]
MFGLHAVKVVVIGAGLMGHGIALTCARAGHAVAVQDPSSQMRDSLASRIAASAALLGLGDADITGCLD